MKDLTRDEFDRLQLQTGFRRPKTPESMKITQLDIDQGFVVPCRWEHKVSGTHRGTGMCSGMSTLHNAAKTKGIKISCRCWEKTLYVMRVA